MTQLSACAHVKSPTWTIATQIDMLTHDYNHTHTCEKLFELKDAYTKKLFALKNYLY